MSHYKAVKVFSKIQITKKCTGLVTVTLLHKTGKEFQLTQFIATKCFLQQQVIKIVKMSKVILIGSKANGHTDGKVIIDIKRIQVTKGSE